MVNNSTYINKTNNHLSPQIIGHLKDITHRVGNPGPGVGNAHKCDGVNQANEIQTLYLW